MTPSRAAVVLAFLTLAIAPASGVAQGPPIPSVQLTPDQFRWQPYLAGGVQALLIGDPSQPGPYVVRLRLPAGLRIPPHTHPDGRVVTVLSGTMFFTFGTQFDSTSLRPFPVGSVWTELPSQPHFAWARDGEVVLQISGTGPSGMTMVPARP